MLSIDPTGIRSLWASFWGEPRSGAARAELLRIFGEHWKDATADLFAARSPADRARATGAQVFATLGLERVVVEWGHTTRNDLFEACWGAKVLASLAGRAEGEARAEIVGIARWAIARLPKDFQWCPLKQLALALPEKDRPAIDDPDSSREDPDCDRRLPIGPLSPLDAALRLSACVPDLPEAGRGALLDEIIGLFSRAEAYDLIDEYAPLANLADELDAGRARRALEAVRAMSRRGRMDCLDVSRVALIRRLAELGHVDETDAEVDAIGRLDKRARALGIVLARQLTTGRITGWRECERAAERRLVGPEDTWAADLLFGFTDGLCGAVPGDDVLRGCLELALRTDREIGEDWLCCDHLATNILSQNAIETFLPMVRRLEPAKRVWPLLAAARRMLPVAPELAARVAAEAVGLVLEQPTGLRWQYLHELAQVRALVPLRTGLEVWTEHLAQYHVLQPMPLLYLWGPTELDTIQWLGGDEAVLQVARAIGEALSVLCDDASE